MKLIHIVGARPQFIKMAAVSRAIAQHNRGHDPGEQIEELIIHTGQHYDYEMSKVFFDELEIPKPDYNLGVGSAPHGEQTGEMLKRIEPVLVKERPDVVLVYGDTNSTLAGALAAAKLHIPVAHIEAGLRSFNKAMPEEINRVLTDHVSTILFCPTETAVKNLQKEGFTNIVNDGHLVSDPHLYKLRTTNHGPVVINVGDVMYDSVLYNLKLAEERSDILNRLHLLPNEPKEPNKPNELNEPTELNKLNKPMRYALATIHRAENTDDPKRLRSIFHGLTEIAKRGLPVILPLHPRTENALQRDLSDHELRTIHSELKIVDPLPYLDMLILEKNAQSILTDSGGVQKEAFILQVPCITLREESEWVETIEAGRNVLAGADKEQIVEAARQFGFQKQKPSGLPGSPYGDGHASERIIEVVTCLRK